MIKAAFVILLVSLLIYILYCWYQDYKKWKYHKNKPIALNPWNDW